MDGSLFSDLIQFSWTITSFIFGAQGWLFLQEFKANRKFKQKHLVLTFSFITNVVAAISLFVLFDLVLDESLKQSKNFVADNIKLARSVHAYALLVSFIATLLATAVWIVTKNAREEKNAKD